MSKLRPLKKLLINNHKAYLVKSLGLSTTLHAGTLFDLTQGEFLQWQAGVHRIYQTIAGKKADGSQYHNSTYQLADLMQSPMPMELMYTHRLRLRLLIHIIRAGDMVMIAAILENFALNQESSWLNCVYYALRWMRDQVGEENVPEELQKLNTVQDWLDFQPAASEIKNLVKKAEQSHLLKVRSFCQLQKQGPLHDQLLREMGWTI